MCLCVCVFLLQCETMACNTTSDGYVQCMPNHFGPLCSVCDHGFAKAADGGCNVCPAIAANSGRALQYDDSSSGGRTHLRGITQSNLSYISDPHEAVPSRLFLRVSPACCAFCQRFLD